MHWRPPDQILADEPARSRTVFVAKVSAPLMRQLVRELRGVVAEVATACRDQPGTLPASLDVLLGEVERAPLSFVSERQRQARDRDQLPALEPGDVEDDAEGDGPEPL